MIANLDEETLEFLECLHNPICMGEALFTNYDNLALFEEGEQGHIRRGQIPLMSFEYMIDNDPELNKKQNFALKMGAGNGYILGGRNFGKTLTEKIDILLSLILLDGYPMGLTSYDAVHIRGVLEPLIDCFNNHPIMNEFKRSVKRSPTYMITTKNSGVLEGINMNVSSKEPGNQFFQKHLKKIWVEEASFEPREVYEKRIDSRHEEGCIERVSGMTNFTKFSPAGKIFYDLTKKPQVLNLPQYINPNWDEEEKKKAIKKYGGENSIGYRIFVKGEVVEEGLSVFDMARVRPYYTEIRQLKRFEVAKKTFGYYKNILILERPKNADQIFICADIGESAPTEIVVIAKVGEKFKYLYEISLFGLTDKEQYKIFKHLGILLEANYIGLDTSDGTGRAIFRSLEEDFPKENLVWCSFQEKIEVGYDTDDKGNILFKNGKPIPIEEYVSEWSIKHLKNILYDGMIEIPENAYKFDNQINSVVCLTSGVRVIYSCVADENHLLQAFQVFSIAHWKNERNLTRPLSNKKFCKTGV